MLRYAIMLNLLLKFLMETFRLSLLTYASVCKQQLGWNRAYYRAAFRMNSKELQVFSGRMDIIHVYDGRKCIVKSRLMDHFTLSLVHYSSSCTPLLSVPSYPLVP